MAVRRTTKSTFDEPVYTPAPMQMPNKKSFWEKMMPLLVIVLILMSFALGSLYTKVKYLESGGATGGTTATGTTGQQQAAAPARAAVTLDQIKALFNNKDLISFGDANRKLLLVEIADPSCPYCHVAAGQNPDLNAQMGDRFKLVSSGGTYIAPVPEMKKLVDAGKASFVYVYFPGHGNGEMGTRALYCGNETGKFWAVHDLLMSGAGYDLMNNTVKNDKTKSGDLANFLKAAVDPTQMKACLDSGKYDGRLTEDTQIGTSLGVQGTPGFFVNTTTFDGAYSYKDMESAVTAALK